MFFCRFILKKCQFLQDSTLLLVERSRTMGNTVMFVVSNLVPFGTYVKVMLKDLLHKIDL